MNAFTRSFFDPFGFWSAAASASAPKPANTKPIEIEARASDRGVTIRAEKDAVVLRGKTEGPEAAVDMFGVNPMAEYARSVSFTLDIASAPTQDLFGRTNYREKNSRIFTVSTSKGWSTQEVAERLAAKVNNEDDFRATVSKLDNGAVKISFARR